MHKTFNVPTMLGTIAIIAMICCAGFVEGGNLIAAVASLIIFGASAYFAAKEDGAIKK